jgi:hypothetical protein
MTRNTLVYRISTGLLTVMMVGGPAMYFFNYEEVSATFAQLGYPTYLVYPLALAKLLGLVAIWTRKVETLKNLAYAGYFYDFILAFFAHVMAGDPGFGGALVALVLVCVSYYSGENLQERRSQEIVAATA